MIRDALAFTPPAGSLRAARALALAGAVALLAGMGVAPQRAALNALLVSQFLMGVGLAAACFVAIEYVTGASWSTSIRRVPEALVALVPVGGILLLLVLLAAPTLYPWTGITWDVREGFVGFKQLWLSRPFFLLRAVLYLLLWSGLAGAIVRTSRRRDHDPSPAHAARSARLSAVFLVVFGLTFWMASYDWLMSLEPRWYSTVFGIYNFSGLFLSGVAAISLLLIWMRAHDVLRHTIAPRHLLDLGRLLFAFSTFWAYIWFCQYMLIWYANFPEETSYFADRMHGIWRSLFLLNLVLNWVAPFFLLMSRTNKQEPRLMIAGAGVVLAGRWLDLYLMIFPPVFGPRPRFGVWEAGGVALIVGLGLLVFFHALRQAPLVPLAADAQRLAGHAPLAAPPSLPADERDPSRPAI